MAETWTALGNALNTNTMSTSKGWFYLYNGATATRIIRIYRIGLLNIQTAAVTGVLATLELRKYTGSPTLSGTAITPVAHDSTNIALEAALTAGSDVTPSGGSNNIMRRRIWSTDEITSGTLDIDMWNCFYPYCWFFDCGYNSTTAQPIVLRAGEAIVIYCSAASGALAGTIDIICTFKNDAS